MPGHSITKGSQKQVELINSWKDNPCIWWMVGRNHDVFFPALKFVLLEIHMYFIWDWLDAARTILRFFMSFCLLKLKQIQTIRIFVEDSVLGIDRKDEFVMMFNWKLYNTRSNQNNQPREVLVGSVLPESNYWNVRLARSIAI